MYKFKSNIEIIGINPFVFVPQQILVFIDAVKWKGQIPVCGTINGKEYTQTLVRYSGEWRLYINTKMVKDSPRRMGEEIEVTIKYDSADRTLTPHPKLIKALKENKKAKAVFDSLSPSMKNLISPSPHQPLLFTPHAMYVPT